MSMLQKEIYIFHILKISLFLLQAQGLSQLRRSLTAAEEDVIRKREEMETLRKQLATPTREIDQQYEIR